MSEESGQELLSQDEQNAFRELLQSSSPQPEVTSIQLGTPEFHLKAAHGQIDELGEAFCDAFSLFTLRQSGSTYFAEKQPIELVVTSALFKEKQLGQLTCVIEGGEAGCVGFLGLGPRLVRYLLDNALGVAPVAATEDAEDAAEAEEPEPPPLSNMDRRVLTPLVGELLKEIAALWSHREEALQLAQLVDSNKLVEFADLTRPSMKLSWKLELPSGPCQLVFVLDAQALQLLPAPRSGITPAQLRSQLLGNLLDTEVPLRVVLGRHGSTVTEVMSLDVGDVVRLDSYPEKPIEAFIEDQCIARGKPMAHHGNLALEVTELAL